MHSALFLVEQYTGALQCNSTPFASFRLKMQYLALTVSFACARLYLDYDCPVYGFKFISYTMSDINHR